MTILLAVFCLIGLWQLAKWGADLLCCLFGKETLGQSFARSMACERTIEDILDELAEAAMKQGKVFTIYQSSIEPHQRFKPSDN